MITSKFVTVVNLALKDYKIIQIKNCYDLKKAYHLAANEGWKIVYTGWKESQLTKKVITKLKQRTP